LYVDWVLAFLIHSILTNPNRWENTVPKRKEDSRYHQKMETIFINGSIGPIPGK